MRKLQIITLALLAFGACKSGKNQSDAYGNFEAVETIVSSETAGKLLSMEVRQGDQLEPSKLIAQIDTTEIILKKLQTEAQLVASECDCSNQRTKRAKEKRSNYAATYCKNVCRQSCNPAANGRHQRTAKCTGQTGFSNKHTVSANCQRNGGGKTPT